MSRTVLVISPHPDDEAIGCGGTIRRHVLAGDRVRVVFLTSGEKGGHGRSADETVRVREREARAAAVILGLDPARDLEFWRLPDGAVRATASAVARLRALVIDLRPATVYVPHDAESHPDHRAAARMVGRAVSAARPKAARPDVLMYEVWTPTARLDHIEDVTAHMPAKLRAIRAYKSQCAVVDFVEAMKGLARYRGEMHSWPEGEYAEVFTRLSGSGRKMR